MGVIAVFKTDSEQLKMLIQLICNYVIYITTGKMAQRVGVLCAQVSGCPDTELLNDESKSLVSTN